jgi:hypothetical protein
MDRPLADRRPLGPFMQSSSGDQDFVMTFDMDTSELSGLYAELEDNITDKLMTSHGGMIDGVSLVRDSPSSIEVKVSLDTPMFSDTHEDEILESVRKELERIGQTDVELSTYRYEF